MSSGGVSQIRWIELALTRCCLGRIWGNWMKRSSTCSCNRNRETCQLQCEPPRGARQFGFIHLTPRQSAAHRAYPIKKNFNECTDSLNFKMNPWKKKVTAAPIFVFLATYYWSVWCGSTDLWLSPGAYTFNSCNETKRPSAATRVALNIRLRSFFSSWRFDQEIKQNVPDNCNFSSWHF